MTEIRCETLRSHDYNDQHYRINSLNSVHGDGNVENVVNLSKRNVTAFSHEHTSTRLIITHRINLGIPVIYYSARLCIISAAEKNLLRFSRKRM